MRRMLFVIAAVCACAFAAEAIAQPISTERKHLTPAAARRMVDACVAFAEKNNATLAVAVVDTSGLLIDFHGMGGGPTTGETAILKAKTAAHWERPTSMLEAAILNGGNQAPLWIGDYPKGGGLPVVIDGQTAGAIGVGGAGTLQEACAQVGIYATLPRPTGARALLLS
jgi:uncharacterized protein GlcG (DUF336 family)